jgi:hypothetical protein
MLLTLLASNSTALSHAQTDTLAAAGVSSGVADPDDVLRVDISLQEGDDDDFDEYEHDDRLRLSESDQKGVARMCSETPSWSAPEICEHLDTSDLGDAFIWDDAYFMMGVAPAATFVPGTFHPSLRYDAELGMSWYHPNKPRVVTIGVDGHVFNLFDRKMPGGGADVVASTSFGPVYLRAGSGVLGGLPNGLDSSVSRPAIGGLVGVGAQVSDGSWGGRVGVDYDVRVDRSLGVMHTVMLSARFAWGF